MTATKSEFPDHTRRKRRLSQEIRHVEELFQITATPIRDRIRAVALVLDKVSKHARRLMKECAISESMALSPLVNESVFQVDRDVEKARSVLMAAAPGGLQSSARLGEVRLALTLLYVSQVALEKLIDNQVGWMLPQQSNPSRSMPTSSHADSDSEEWPTFI
jgi:hypothetical protein